MNNFEKFLKYMKGLNHLHSKSPHAVRSILTAFNYKRHTQDEKAKKISRYQDLPEQMLERDNFDLVIDMSKEFMMDDPNILNEFLEIIDAEPIEIPVPKYQVKDFMEEIPPGTVYRPKDTLAEAIHFFANMPPGVRYLLVVDDAKALKGMISVNDFDRFKDKIKALRRNTYLIDLDFLRKDPKVLSGEATMQEADDLFKKSEKEGRKITKILVVDNEKRAIGYLGEEGIAKWSASLMES